MMISFQRLYHVSKVGYSLNKQGMKLCKMISPKNKKTWYPEQIVHDSLPTIKSLAKTKHEPGKRGIRRTAMLNKLFMKQITDIMSTGTVSMGVVGRGIEISKVKVTPDFNTVNVYWVCRGTASDKNTESVLQKIAGALRHELSTLRVMGEVPYIVFVKDQQEAQVADLNHRLANADYGEDYVLTEEGHLLKSEFVLNTKLSPEVKAKIKQLEDELPIVQKPLPEMTHNVYGLDHAKIMSRLLAARKKSQDAWTNLTSENEVISYRAPANTAPQPAICRQNNDLAEFLLQRQILNKKLAKQMKDTRDDRLLLTSSYDDELIRQSYYYGEDEEYEEEEDDYEEEKLNLEEFENPPSNKPTQ